MSKKGATSSHTVGVKPGALRHNRREVKLSNVNPEFTHKNEAWESSIIKKKEYGGEGRTIDSLIKERANHYRRKNGRSAPGYGPNGKAVPAHKRAAFIREACVVIKEETTLDDVKRFADSVCSSFGVKCLGIWLHKDEGYYKSAHIKEDGVEKNTPEKDKWKPNLHAHVLFDWYNFETAKIAHSTWCKDNWYARMQDMAAAALGMERGEPSKRKHIASMEFARKQAEKRIEMLEKRLEEIQNEKSQDLAKIQLGNLLQALGHHKLSTEINEKKKELEALEAQRKKSEKAQQTQIQNLINDLKTAKENNDREIQKLEAALQAKIKIYQNSMSQYDTKIQDIENQLNEYFNAKYDELQADLQSKHDELAQEWNESYDELLYNSEGRSHSNRIEQLIYRHDRLEQAFAPLIKNIIEVNPEVVRKAMRSLPSKETSQITSFLRQQYPSIAPLLSWGSAPGVIGSEPRRKRKGDDDDDDEYNGGISR